MPCWSTLKFLKGFLLTPRSIGAVLPSSASLAHAMADHIDINKEGFVLELGPGTGAITQAILETGLAPSRLIALELSPSFAKDLQKRFSGITVIEGSASELITLIKEKNIHTIISSLPLRSLSKITRQKILSSIQNILEPQDKFIQFTYSFLEDRNYYPDNAELIETVTVWQNIPPAKVQVFRMKTPSKSETP
jgi:phosphatidylethanolamine/phosphatidyl-N-methylethanolamine N-methyltransferase